MDQPAERKHSRFLTKRLLLSVVGLAVGSALCWYGKLDGENWVFALAIVIAGHHAEDIVKVIRK